MQFELEDAEEDDICEDPLLRRSVRRSVLSFAARVLQFFCAFLLAMAAACFAYLSMEQLRGTPGIRGEVSRLFLLFSGGILLYLLLSIFWVISRRRYCFEKFRAKERVDSGRGITVFLLLLLYLYAGYFVLFVLRDKEEIHPLPCLLAGSITGGGAIIRNLSVGGLLLSILRRILGKLSRAGA